MCVEHKSNGVKVNIKFLPSLKKYLYFKIKHILRFSIIVNNNIFTNSKKTLHINIKYLIFEIIT